MLNDWPHLLTAGILYVGILLEVHLSDLVEHFSWVVRSGGGYSLRCLKEIGCRGRWGGKLCNAEVCSWEPHILL